MTVPHFIEKRRYVILCVDDEDALRRDIADELIEAGHDVVEARDGQEALDSLAGTCPDLILCDISMPGVSGYDVLNAVKSMSADYDEIPFVFLSALADPKEVVNGKRLGADDYLVKPIDYDLLLVTVEARLRQIDRIRAVRAKCATIHVDALSSSFGLTPTESRVALALTEGKMPSEIAAGFGISRTTVAFHLRNIFQKTGTSRQAELVILLLQ